MPSSKSAENRGRQGQQMPTGRRFRPGHSGNPGGRPKEEREVVEALRLRGLELAEKLIALGLKGNVRAIEVAFNRAYGKARQVVELEQPSDFRPIDVEALQGDVGKTVRALLAQLEAALGVGARFAVQLPPAGTAYNYRLLDDGELRQLRGLLQKATGHRAEARAEGQGNADSSRQTEST
jgi:hypothetical protein